MDSQKFNQLLKKIKYDKNAIAEIYEEYYPNLIFHLKRKFGKKINPEDIVHDTFYSLMNLENAPTVEFPTTWLYRVADHKAIDRIRREEEVCSLSDTYPDTFFLDDLVLKEDVRQALKTLDPLSQTILIMHHYEGYSHKEIAEELHISCANVRTKASRAYAAMNSYLKKM